jgi:hypothetical protein
MAFNARQLALKHRKALRIGFRYRDLHARGVAPLLAAAPPHVAAYRLQAFAGVRTAELMRLAWHDLERRSGHIEITAKAGKNRLPPADTDPAEPFGMASRSTP